MTNKIGPAVPISEEIVVDVEIGGVIYKAGEYTWEELERSMYNE